eukprot:11474570-Ditylum_brightwellii.AAC.1
MEISEFNPLILRTPQRSNITKSKQQEEEPTPNSLLNTEEQANPTMEQNQATTNNTSQTKQNSIENQLLLLHTKLSEMENKAKWDQYKT